MSDYRHIMAVRYKLDKLDDNDELQDFMEDKCSKVNKNGEFPHEFSITLSDNDMYLDYEYFSSYGEESGTWYDSRYVTNKEFELIKELFIDFMIPDHKTDFRVVNYCYYNSCEPDDCWEVENDELTREQLFN